MRIEQFVDEGLGNTTHLVYAAGSGAAAVIDPLRDVDVYVAAADALSLRITHVFETHVHNDFISGARELAARTGAQVCASATGELAYAHRPLKDGERIRVGGMGGAGSAGSAGSGVEFTVLATPGHTPEHLAYLARDLSAPSGPIGRAEPGEPAALFSGGSLLVGAVSRTDLLGRAHAAAYAHQLFHSLHQRILGLPDETRVYPTHGAGSFCTATPGAARSTTIGHERQTNPLLQLDEPAAFAAALLRSMPSYPAYFAHMREINRQRPPLLGGLPALPPLTAERVSTHLAAGAALVDARPVAQYATGHIPGAYSVELRPAFASWAGWVVPFGAPLVVVAESPEAHEEIVRQLLRIGYDRLLGHLDGGMPSWEAAGLPVRRLPAVTVQEVHQALTRGAGLGRGAAPRSAPPSADASAPATADGLVVLDARQDAEWEAGHVAGARHIEAGALVQHASELPAGATIAVHCGHEQRAATAISVLERAGFGDVRLIAGGWDAWEAAGLPVARPHAQPDAPAGGRAYVSTPLRGVGTEGGRP